MLTYRQDGEKGYNMIVKDIIKASSSRIYVMKDFTVIAKFGEFAEVSILYTREQIYQMSVNQLQASDNALIVTV